MLISRNTKEILIKNAFLVIATLSILIIFFIFIFLFREAFPAFKEIGLSLFTSDWNVSQGKFGLNAAIFGSIVVTGIAMLIAVPLGIGGAIFLSEISTLKLRIFLKPLIELLAGIPSIVFGFIGVIVFVPYLGRAFDMLAGYSLLIGGIILGVMALPTIVSISDDALKAVPREIKEGSLALGASNWETIKQITFPSAISGIAAACIMGIGRAIGETMAVMLVVGSVMKIPFPFFDVFETSNTITGLIAGQMGEAWGIHVNVLFAAAVILFLIVALLSIGSDLLQARVERKFKGG
jgi:phosphate ABC transporter permease protein PstC